MNARMYNRTYKTEKENAQELELLQNIVDAREDIFNPFGVRCIMITV